MLGHGRHPAGKRVAVATLMRDTDLSVESIAARIGVPYPTVCKWNQQERWRPSAKRSLAALRPERWPTGRILALARVFEVPEVDPGDLAEAAGMKRERADALFRACGFPDGIARHAAERGAADGLRTALRAHAARQIAAFDAALSDREAGVAGAEPWDSAKVLRDLGGLKRLLDDLDAGPSAPPLEAASDMTPAAIDDLRSSIVGRFARLAGTRAAAPPNVPDPPSG